MLRLTADLYFSVDDLARHDFNSTGGKESLFELVAVHKHHGGLHLHGLVSLSRHRDNRGVLNQL